ncbi:TPA: hypothetical protein L4T60_004456 [Pseudomonas aeruginosa]|uniref:hypothetical protein n=1 Tax=Pseudomonas aeruginosa TaxID=287 RepID=UPI000F5237D2|nr:hypothetical protein [Pseudomonas aeruginosa]EKG0328139.1 hypothetical protein [Pseudomonas aeruginosa]MBH8872542.1 hypothetical protein [Pseudomonas aeruginosa]MBI8682785.1 hypothetical protein [Pseudomonas aeruginosa]MBX5509323.1 hypothetical protein [Pseudomonas aeruginosa]MBX5534051.1 hypothetical protein [Pseudomonas aeruginosa]
MSKPTGTTNMLFSKRIKKLEHTLEKSFKKTKSLITRIFYYLIFSLGSAIFFASINYYLAEQQYLYLASICGPVFAVLLGFTALLYNRSRAYKSGPIQRRTVYAAERSFQATILFALGTGSGAILTTILWHMNLAPAGEEAISKASLLFFVPIGLILHSFLTFFFAIRAIAHKNARHISLKAMAQKIRRET